MVALARVTRPVGLKGGVRVELLCDGPERLKQVERVLVGTSPGRTQPLTLSEVSVRGNGVVVFFDECSTRPEAQGLRDHYLFIPESDSIPSPDGSARVHEVLGCEVRTQNGRRLGKVSKVYDLPAHRTLGVVPDGGGAEVLVPDVEAWVLRVDTENKVVVVTSDELFGTA